MSALTLTMSHMDSHLVSVIPNEYCPCLVSPRCSCCPCLVSLKSTYRYSPCRVSLKSTYCPCLVSRNSTSLHVWAARGVLYLLPMWSTYWPFLVRQRSTLSPYLVRPRSTYSYLRTVRVWPTQEIILFIQGCPCLAFPFLYRPCLD
jgi:hypothetical protein